MSEKLYVLGHPVAHSKSPVMHNAALRALGLDWEYGFADCATEAEAQALLARTDWLALNITMPYKPLAASVATERSAAVQLAGGANVLVRYEGALHADNTDGRGCVAYLVRAGVELEGSSVVVCGTGPTSCAIMHACATAGAAHVTLLGRDAAKSGRILGDYLDKLQTAPEPMAQRGCFSSGEYDAATKQLADADVIVDATPLGMKPDDPAPFDVSVLSAGQTVFDVVYGHGTTALVAAARAAGCTALDGAGMLVGQAVETLVDIAAVTGAFAMPTDLDLFAIMAQAAGFGEV